MSAHGSANSNSNTSNNAATNSNSAQNGNNSHSGSKNNRVVVVGVIGKSVNGHATLLNDLLDVSAFKPIYSSEAGPSATPIDQQVDLDQMKISTYYMPSTNVQYLSLIVPPQTSANLDDDAEAIHATIENEEYQHLKAILFLFHVCHILLVVQNGDPTFDVDYLRIFRLLSSFKHSIAATINQHAGSPEYKMGPSLHFPGKCVPIVTFVFNVSSNLQLPKIEASTEEKPSLLKTPSDGPKDLTYRKLEQSLEMQIKFFLKRTKLYVETSQLLSGGGLPLFTVDPALGMVRVVSSPVLDSTRVLSTFLVGSNPSQALPMPRNLAPPGRRDAEISVDDGSLYALIMRQVKFYQGQPGKREHPHPTLRAWQAGANAIQNLFLQGASASQQSSKRGGAPKSSGDIVEKLKSNLDPDSKFSASRSTTALAMARDVYTQNLPNKYTAQVHEKQLAKALQVFHQHASGPATSSFVARLLEDVDKIWKTGRQLDSASANNETTNSEINNDQPIQTHTPSQRHDTPTKSSRRSRSHATPTSSQNPVQK